MASTNKNYSDKYIESKDYDYYLQLTKSNAAKTCAVNEMASYGLTADITSTGDPNPICPQIQGNCCGPKDQERIKAYWEADNRHQAGYHIAYLNMNKYILGKVKGYQSIAANIIEQSQRLELAGKNKVGQGTDKSSQIDTGKPYSFEYHPICHEAAKKFNSLDFVDRRKAQNFYETLNRRANFMQDARRGFYCTLCNAQAKNYISTFRAIFDSRLWYSKDFCQMIYANTFSAIYSIYKSYNPFLKSLLQMMMCVRPKGEGSGNRAAGNQQDNGRGGPQVNINIRPVTIDIDLKLKNPLKDSKLSKAMKEMLDNPLKVTSKFWMEICYNADPNSLFFRARCMGFCENFEMTQASPLMDGDLDALKNVYRTLQEYEFALDSPDTDIFDSDVVALKRGIETEISYLKGNYNFYRALSPTINFSKYKIEFSILKKGHNPMQLSQGTTLEFKYKNAGVWHAILGVLCLFMLR